MDVRKLCRTCLSDNEISLRSIYLKASVVFDIPKCSFFEKQETVSESVDNVLLADMLDECCSPIIHVINGAMPEQLCTQCETELIAAYIFRKRCEKAMDQMLNFMRENGKIDPINIEIPSVEKDCFDIENTSGNNVDAALQHGMVNDAEIWIVTNDDKLLERKSDNQIDGLAANGTAERMVTDENDVSNTTERKMHTCAQCSKVFSRATHLKRHMMIHSDERPFTCTKCDKSFRRTDHLQTHQNSHAVVKPHECEYCSRGFTRAEHLRNHIFTQHTEGTDTTKPSKKIHICTICNFAFASSKCLNVHRKTMHSECSVECKICAKKFDSRQMLNEHGKTHGNDKHKQFLCSECGMTFVRNDYLVVHMRRHNGEKPYKCKYCGKGFPRATDLKVHERYHTGEKRHLCTMCGKGFQRAYNLVVHMRVHTGERPYQCSQCSKSFAQGNDLKAHFRRHTGERYRCDICGEAFIQGYHLTQHKQSVHGIDMLSHIRRVEKIHSKPMNKDRIDCDDINRAWNENGVVATGD